MARSLLVAYMRKKRKAEASAAAALLTLFVFMTLVMLLANTYVAAVADATAHYNAHPEAYAAPATGLAATQPAAQIAIWVLALMLLVPLELMLRKRK